MSSWSFWKSGNPRTLFASFLYFDISFMVWVMLGPMAVLITQSLDLSSAQRGVLVALPLLTGALLRPVMGWLVDQIGPRRAGLVGQLLVIGALVAAWLLGVHSYTQALLLGGFLGVAGSSFAVALPLASSWYPPQHQGKAMGIAGAGNSGTVLASLFVPALAVAYGWNNVLGMALIPLLIALVVYWVMAQESPNKPAPKKLSQYAAMLRNRDTWIFMGMYSVTFGGFSALASFLPVYFHDVYGMDPIKAGLFTSACVFAGSMVRPLGGAIADKAGGVRTLTLAFLLAGSFLMLVALGLQSAGMALAAFIASMLFLGAGNGAIFQLVPQAFPKSVGVATGLVGMAGGVGGFALTSFMGLSKQVTGEYVAGLSAFTLLAVLALGVLTVVKSTWRRSWGEAALGARI